MSQSPVLQFVASALAAIVLALACTNAVQATPIVVANGSIGMFREIRGPNNAGFSAGDRFQLSANITGGSQGVSIT
jgi:uncharacterized membrane protein YjjB (DUF3815 family)